MKTQDNNVLSDVFNDFIGTPPEPQPPIEGVADPVVEPSGADVTPSKGTNTPSNSDAVSEPTTPDAVQPPVDDSDDVSWDSLIDEGTSTSEPTLSDVNWSEIGKAIGITADVKGVEDVTTYVKSLQQTVEDLKSKPALDESVPVEIKEALEIHKNGGDYMSYLMVSAEDYSTADPIELFEDEVAELFYDEKTGQFNEQQYYDYIDSISDADKLFRGKQIQRELTMMQKEKKRELQEQVYREKQANLQALEKSLDQFNKVGTFEVTPKVKKQMLQELASGQFMQNLGVAPDGKHNWNKLLDAYFKARYFDTVQAYNEKKAQRSTMRQVLDSTTNSSVKRNGTLGNAAESAPAKSGIDLYLEKFKI